MKPVVDIRFSFFTAQLQCRTDEECGENEAGKKNTSLFLTLQPLLHIFFLTEHHATKAYWTSGGIAPRVLDMGTRWRRVVSFMSCFV
jgi:hypothetical protein